MTALDQYEKLEATGIWRAGAEAQRRDVFVALGEATLVIHDGKDVALSHWSLPAVRRLNPGKSPAIYGLDADAPEELEIEDATMVAAIERVRSAVERTRPRQGRLRLGLIAAVFVAIALLGTLWMPGALARQASAILPEASRAAIGEALLEELRPLTGPACRTSAGDLALARLKNRLLPNTRHRIAVVPSGLTGAVHLPGGLLLVGRAAVEDYEDPDVVAGYVLSEAAGFAHEDPMIGLLSTSGLNTTLSLLTRGEIPGDALSAYARQLVAETSAGIPEASVVRAAFQRADVAISPFAYALDPTGESVLPLIEAETARGDARRPILADGDWVALQNICASPD